MLAQLSLKLFNGPDPNAPVLTHENLTESKWIQLNLQYPIDSSHTLPKSIMKNRCTNLQLPQSQDIWLMGTKALLTIELKYVNIS